jgi:hypothetical protein
LLKPYTFRGQFSHSLNLRVISLSLGRYSNRNYLPGSLLMPTTLDSGVSVRDRGSMFYTLEM